MSTIITNDWSDKAKEAVVAMKQAKREELLANFNRRYGEQVIALAEKPCEYKVDTVQGAYFAAFNHYVGRRMSDACLAVTACPPSTPDRGIYANVGEPISGWVSFLFSPKTGAFILTNPAPSQRNIAASPDRQPVIRVRAMPADTNPGGTIFGGWIMSQADMAGSIAALRRAQGKVVTVAVNSFEFRQPVYIGDLVSCYCEIMKIGRTSMVVKVEVYAERGSNALETIKVTEAAFTFVALDEAQQPRAIPPET